MVPVTGLHDPAHMGSLCFFSPRMGYGVLLASSHQYHHQANLSYLHSIVPLAPAAFNVRVSVQFDLQNDLVVETIESGIDKERSVTMRLGMKN